MNYRHFRCKKKLIGKLSRSNTLRNCVKVSDCLVFNSPLLKPFPMLGAFGKAVLKVLLLIWGGTGAPKLIHWIYKLSWNSICNFLYVNGSFPLKFHGICSLIYANH